MESGVLLICCVFHRPLLPISDLAAYLPSQFSDGCPSGDCANRAIKLLSMSNLSSFVSTLKQTKVKLFLSSRLTCSSTSPKVGPSWVIQSFKSDCHQDCSWLSKHSPTCLAEDTGVFVAPRTI